MQYSPQVKTEWIITSLKNNKPKQTTSFKTNNKSMTATVMWSFYSTVHTFYFRVQFMFVFDLYQNDGHPLLSLLRRDPKILTHVDSRRSISSPIQFKCDFCRNGLRGKLLCLIIDFERALSDLQTLSRDDYRWSQNSSCSSRRLFLSLLLRWVSCIWFTLIIKML